MPFLKRLISICRLIVEVLNDQNLFTESNLANWFSNYVQFCLGGHFSEQAEAARQSGGKINHLNSLYRKRGQRVLEMRKWKQQMGGYNRWTSKRNNIVNHAEMKKRSI